MTKLTEHGATLKPDPTGARIRVRVIDAGTGSSGIYPASTIEAAAPLVKRGTPIYLDHPTVTESMERPERSVKDIAGYFETGGVYDVETKAIVAEASIIPHWREAVSAMAEHIGLSIRADGEVQEAEGRRVITRLNSIESVDLVTKAGRGGKVLALLESARPQTLEESTHNTLRDRLDEEIRRSHGDAMAEDVDDTYVFFRIWSGQGNRDLYRQAYTATDTTVSLTAEKQPVARSTVYTPVEPTTPTQKEAATVAETNIAEADASNKAPAPNNGGGGNGGQQAPTDPKDKRIAELEAQVADLKAKLAAAKNGTTQAKESAQNEDEQVTESAQGEHPGIDYDQLAEAYARHLSHNGAGQPTGLGGTRHQVTESGDPGITNPAAILAALHGGH